MRTHRLISFLAAAVVATTALTARADCTAGRCLPGGGAPETDCTAEFLGTGLHLNYPPFDPAAPAPKTEIRCYDGDAGCDSDGQLDGRCTFNVNVCLAASDPALPSCAVSSVQSVKVKAKGANARALHEAARALMPLAAPACTDAQTLAVRLKRSGRRLGPGRAKVRVLAEGSAGVDEDTLVLRCLRRDWPSHGFDHANHRATPYERRLRPSNVGRLTVAWELDTASGVTATPTMGHGLLFVPAWNGHLYAVRPKDGAVAWDYDTESPLLIGIQSSAAVTADGRVIVADGLMFVHCLDALTGRLLWKTLIGAPPIDHVWASAQVANNRVFVGVAALLDDPATPGRLVALDLDTGAMLWERRSVPEKICRTDTSIECAVDGDCPEGGPCVQGLGAGVTATVAVDPTGEVVYANTVGSFTFPAIGDTDSIMRLDAATGATVWITQVTPDEQFGACEGDTSIDCGTDAMCGAAGPCKTKGFYHDFGFLNGPLLVTADDGAGGTRDLVVSGSKDGSLYAFHPDTGAIVWRNEILPVPVTPFFAGWGLFNGAVAFAGGRFFAALDGHAAPLPAVPPKHLMAFSAVDGATVWQDEIENSWSHVDVANGVIFAGPKEDPILYAYDAETGARLATFDLPAPSAGGVIVVDGRVFIPYGIFGGGGVRAYRLP